MDINFSELNLLVDESVNTFSFQGHDIEVKKYLPVEQKYDLVMVALQKSKEPSGCYNDLKLTTYFELNIVYLYTNIQFTDEDREDEAALYDMLQSSGLLEEIIEHMDEKEYTELYNTVHEIRIADTRYSTTVAGMLSKFMSELPANAEKAKSTLDQFDPEKFKELMSFVTALNGGRDLVIHEK